jgi:hypothetical protein
VRKTLTLACAAAVTSCAPAPPAASGAFTVHGTEYVCSSVSSPRMSYPGIGAGRRVTVLGPSGRTVAAGTLTAAAPGAATSAAGSITVFTWQAAVPGGLARYGISLQGERTAWVTGAQMAAGPAAGQGC